MTTEEDLPEDVEETEPEPGKTDAPSEAEPLEDPT